MTLIKNRELAGAKVGIGVEDIQFTAVKIINPNFLVWIDGSDIDIENSVDVEIGVDSESGNCEAIDGVFGEFRVENPVEDAGRGGDGDDEEDEEEERPAKAFAEAGAAAFGRREMRKRDGTLKRGIRVRVRVWGMKGGFFGGGLVAGNERGGRGGGGLEV